MAAEYVRRTAITRLAVTDQQRELLEATITDWKTACNIAARIGWRTGETQKSPLQSRSYDKIREETQLGSQHAVLASHHAASALSGFEEIEGLEEEYEVSRPEFTSRVLATLRGRQ